jgi:predicted transcriptional regulator
MKGAKWPVLLLIFLLCCLSVKGAQPSLPTIFYGKVINVDKSPAIDFKVTAEWKDSNGNIQQKSVDTLSEGEFSGYYFFNNGYVQAVEGSMIVLFAGGVEKEFEADPGGESLRLEDIDLSDKSVESSQQPNNGGGSGSGSGSGTGTGDYTGFEWSDHSDNQVEDLVSSLPTSLYGQVLDELGKPVENEQITVTWTDRFNIEHTSKTRTLTKQQAEVLGDPELAGYYLFNDGDISAAQNSSILISHKQGESSVEADPGETVKTNLFSSRSGNSIGKQPDPTQKRSNIVISATQFSLQIQKHAKNKVILVAIIVIIMAVLAGLLLRPRVNVSVGSGVLLPFGGLKADVNKLSKKRVSEFMTKKMTVNYEDDDLDSVVSTLVAEQVGASVIINEKNSKISGILTNTDIINKSDLSKGFGSIFAKEIMNKKVECITQSMSFKQVVEFSVKNNFSVMPVEKNKKLIGLVTWMELLAEFDQFFSKNVFEGSTNPRAKEIMTKKMLVANEGIKLSDVVSRLKSSDFCCVLVVNKAKDIVNLISKNDILSEIHSIPSAVKVSKLNSFGKKPVHTVYPGNDVFEVAFKMLDKGVGKLPVIDDKRIVGVITAREVLRAMCLFLFESEN